MLPRISGPRTPWSRDRLPAYVPWSSRPRRGPVLAPAERPSEPVPLPSRWPRHRLDGARPAGRVLRWWLLGALAVTLVLLLGTGWYALSWTGVYPGVRVGDLAVGGVSRAEAASRLELAAAQWDATIVTLRAPQGAYTFTRSELGLRYDRDDALSRVLGAGREGNQLVKLRSVIALAWAGAYLAPSFWVDEPVLRARLETLATATDIQARDGDLLVQDGRVVVIAPVEGRGLDVDAAARQIIAAVAPEGETSFTLPVAERIQPRVNAAVLARAETRAKLLLAPVELRVAGSTFPFDTTTIATWITVQRLPDGDEPLALTVDAARVRAAVAPLAGRVARAAREPLYAFDPASGRLAVTVPATGGRELDLEATTTMVLRLLERPGARADDLVSRAVPPKLSNQDVALAADIASRTYLAGPLTFRDGSEAWTLPPARLAEWLTILPGGELAFDDDALAAYIVRLKGTINRPAIDATYTMDEGSDVYRVTGASQTGRLVDGPAAFKSALALLQTAGTGTRVVTLPVAELRPAVTEADVAALVPERWIEVDLTAQRLRAVVGKRVVYSAVISSGKKGWETPTGTFYILYRVANETMTSDSIGAEEYYRLENVLYTQYFTNEGHALHYSWWKTPESFGTPSSHGCISQQLADAEYFWNFGQVGTRIYIHGVAPIG